MRILLTNDDGYDAPGLRALFEAVRRLEGVEGIDVIAPREAQSGKSHAVSASFTCRSAVVEGMGPVVVLDGTPADCVRAIFALPNHPRPDWVLSGINRGGNLGVDIYYSGTVAAAREAAIHGIPAVALSQYVRPEIPDQWEASGERAAAVLAALLLSAQVRCPRVDASLVEMTRSACAGHSMAVPRVPCWNVNLPSLPAGERVRGVKVVAHSIEPLLTDYMAEDEDAGDPLYRYAGNYQNRPRSAGTDVGVVFEGGISISPLRL